MGYMRHHAIVVTGPQMGLLSTRDVWERIRQIAESHNCSTLVGSLLPSRTNGYDSFFIAPDGSKEGWNESDNGDKFRAAVVIYLDSLRYEDGSTSFDYVEVQFGDDNRETKIIAASDWPAAQPGKKEGPCQNQPDTTSIATVTAASVGGNSQSESASAGTSDTPVAPLRRIHATIEHSSMTEPFGDLAEHLQDCCGGCPYCHELCQKAVDEVATEPAPQVTAPQPQVTAEWGERKQLYELAETICDFTGVGLYDDKIRDEVKRKLIEHASSLLAERDRSVINYGKGVVAWITGDPNDAADVKDVESAWRVIKEAHRLGQQRNNERNELQDTVAERDRTIAELLRRKGDHCCDAQFDLEAMRQHFTALGLTETNTKKDGLIEQIWRNTRAEQAEQERDALKGSTWGAAYEVTQKAVATAERLRGLLREANSLLAKVSGLPHSKDFDALKGLRQRIQKELEGRP